MYISENEFLLKEWNTGKNDELGLNPEKLVLGSNKYAFWKCSICNNEWKAQIAKRGIRGQGCPLCGRKKSKESRVKNRIEGQGSLADNFPDIADEWDYSRNLLHPSEVVSGSNKKVFWKCKECGYKWEAVIAKRTVRGQGCPICGEKKRHISQHDLLTERIKKEGSLGLLYPQLVNEWDYDKNDKTPFDYLSGSNVDAYWICSVCGHKWKAKITNRAKGIGCIVCGRKQGKETLLMNLIRTKGSLADNAPEIAEEWDYEKNGDLIPQMVMLNTNKSVWWVCGECGYSWKTGIRNRASGRGCPRCGLIKQGISLSRPIEGLNDLLSQAPELASEFHPYKNGNLKPNELTRSSNKKIWWLGRCGHEWMAAVGSRYSGRGCPLCLREFKISYPEKAIYYYLCRYLPVTVEENYRSGWLGGKELDIYIPDFNLGIEYDGSNWHRNPAIDEEKNQICKINNVDLLRIREIGTPDIDFENIYYIKATSEKDIGLQMAIQFVFKYISTHYQVQCDYIIDLPQDRASIYELMEQNRKENSLGDLYPEIAVEWHPTKNGKITPQYVNAHTHRKYWWICPLGHEYEMVVKHRVEKQINCPICSSHRVLAGYNDLATKKPDIAAMWDYEANGDLRPSEVMEFSNRKVWWKCQKGHSYQRVIAHQTSRDAGCPICKMQLLKSGINDLVTLYPDIASEWDYALNGNANPEEYTPISHKRFNWVCKKCGSKWNISINSRCILGHGCPKCAGIKRWKTRQHNEAEKGTDL